MVKISRRSGTPALVAVGALAVVLGGPSIASAQLLPNAQIRRERPPCVAEPPFYGQVRQQYFGYYPTCWRKFPPGWACPCPNPELPDWAASLKANPIKTDTAPAPGPAEDDLPGGPGRVADPSTDPGLPPAPNDNVSPFDPDVPKPDRPAPMDGPRRAAPRPAPADLPPRTEVVPAPRTEAPAEVASAPARPASRVADAAAEEVPVLALPGAEDDAAPAAPAVGGMPSAPGSSLPVPAIAEGTPVPPPLAPAVQAPARRSILGNLFGRSRRR